MSAAEQTPHENQETPQALEDPQFEQARGEGIPETHEESSALVEPQTSEVAETSGNEESDPTPRRRDRSRGLRGGLAALPVMDAESETPEPATPETPSAPAKAEEPAATPEPETPALRPIYNTDVPDGVEQRIALVAPSELSSQSTKLSAADRTALIDQAIAEYTKKNAPSVVDPTARPNLSGPQQSYRVVRGPDSQRNLDATPSRPALEPETPEASAATPEPVVASTLDEEVRLTQPTAPAAPAAPASRRTAPANVGGLYAQLGLAESPLTTDRSQLRGASRTGLASTGVPVPSSREIRNSSTPEPATTSGEASAEPSEPSVEPPRRGRHRREKTPASFAERVLGYTLAHPTAETASSSSETASNPDNETTQKIPIVNLGEAPTGEAAPRLSRTQRLRARIGAIATVFGGFSENFQQNREIHQLGDIIPPNQRPGIQPGMNKAERRLEKRRQEIEADADSEQSSGIPIARFMSSEENAQHERSRGARRRRMIGAVGLVAASAGLMMGVGGDMARDEAPRSSISANQLPSQPQERQESISSIFDDQIDTIKKGIDRQVESLEKGDKHGDTSNEQTAKTVDVGNEKITLDNDGSVTIKLEKGGNYWEGVHEAERLLDIDDSATATANAVNTIGFEKGEDRSQKVGAKVTFKNVNGKLVANRA